MNKKESQYEVQVKYFSKTGPKNTPEVLRVIAARARELSIQQVLIPSCSGRTALKALEMLPDDLRLIAVTHVTGFREPNHQELDEGTRAEIEKKNAKVLTAQHAFGGVGRAIRNQFSTYQIDEIIASSLRVFGHGTKVAIELALMAADAGLVRTDRDVISTGGTMRGIDTALVLRPANSFHFFDLKVKEILCKPSSF